MTKVLPSILLKCTKQALLRNRRTAEFPRMSMKGKYQEFSWIVTGAAMTSVF